MRDNYGVDHNVVGSTGASNFLLPPVHMFVITSNLMQMLTSRGMFVDLPSEDQYAYINKVTRVSKSSVGTLDLNIYAIGLCVLPSSLNCDATMWLS